MVRKTLFLCIISFLFLSCIEKVNLNTEDEPDVCLNYLLKNGDVQTLHLCWSKGNSDSVFIPITDAEVNLYKRNGTDSTLVGSFRYVDSTEWRLEYNPETMCEYSITVKVKGNESEVYSRTRMPGKISRKHLGKFDIPPSTMIRSYDESKLECEEQCTIWLSVFDEKHIRFDTLSFSVVNDHYSNIDHYSEFLYTFDPSFASLILYKNFIRFYHTPDYINSYHVPYELYKPSPYNPNEWEDLELSIDEKGIICGPCFSIQPINTFIFNNPVFRLSNLYYHFLSVSAEYDTYLKTNLEYRDRYLEEMKNGTFTTIFQTHNTYTNIVNGRGIFGAAYELIFFGNWSHE